MNLEISFRGLRTDGKGWVYGGILIKYGKAYIITAIVDIGYHFASYVEVDPKTVGQLTPFKDVHGNQVYIGDLIIDVIVRMASEVVFTDYGNIGIRSLKNQVVNLEYETIDPSWFATSAEVVGNIHENPTP